MKYSRVNEFWSWYKRRRCMPVGLKISWSMVELVQWQPWSIHLVPSPFLTWAMRYPHLTKRRRTRTKEPLWIRLGDLGYIWSEQFKPKYWFVDRLELFLQATSLHFNYSFHFPFFSLQLTSSIHTPWAGPGVSLVDGSQSAAHVLAPE